MDESYSIVLTADSGSATLTAPTVFGALRGLETFAQMAVDVEADGLSQTMPGSFSISDSPRYAYRGLMMDFSRSFYPVSFIEHTIDAMSMNKLNVLHMHITVTAHGTRLTGDQSFTHAHSRTSNPSR